jgi:hypothetical protein
MTGEFGHEALAELHDFIIRFAFGSKSLPPLAPPIGRPVQRVLEDLFET